MEVLRVPPYPLSTTWTLPIPNYEYIVYVEDLVDHSVTETNLFSDANGKLVYEIPLAQVQYDRKFLIKFYDTEHIHTLYEENLDIVRPYVDPNKLGTTASEIEEYKTLEMVARSLIDTVVVNGFYNSKHIVQRNGDGSDYFAIWEDINRVLKVYENNVLIYDIDTPETNVFEFKTTFDSSAVERVIEGQYNRLEQGTQQYPKDFGDLANIFGTSAVGFPKGWDYTFVLDIGYRALPPDVEYATKLLIEDLKCGKLDYYTRYVTSYNSDQYRIQFDKSIFSGTGNMIVDKILDKYVVTIAKPGLI
jgi:hypothetical protein